MTGGAGDERDAVTQSISGYGWTTDGLSPFWPGLNCLHCGRFVGRDGIFNYECWEMTSEVASLDAECAECAREAWKLLRGTSLASPVDDRVLSDDGKALGVGNEPDAGAAGNAALPSAGSENEP